MIDSNDPVMQQMPGFAANRNLEIFNNIKPATNKAQIMREQNIKPGTEACLNFGSAINDK